MLRPSQLAAEAGGMIHRDLFKWLSLLSSVVGFGIVPTGGIVAAKISAGDLSVMFDGTGLGRRGTRFEGWAICNGANSTDDWSGEPMAPYLMRLG